MFTETIFGPFDIFRISVTADQSATGFGTYTLIQKFTLLTFIPFNKVTISSAMRSFMVVSCKYIACRTDIAVVLPIIYKLVMRKSGVRFYSMFLVRYTTVDIVFMQIFIISCCAVAFVRYSCFDLCTGLKCMFFECLGHNLIIINICRCRNCCGYNSGIIINYAMIFITECTFAVFTAYTCI